MGKYTAKCCDGTGFVCPQPPCHELSLPAKQDVLTLPASPSQFPQPKPPSQFPQPKPLLPQHKPQLRPAAPETPVPVLKTKILTSAFWKIFFSKVLMPCVEKMYKNTDFSDFF
jgi:hypothetical protein